MSRFLAAETLEGQLLLDRRKLLRGALAVGVGLPVMGGLLAACGGEGDDDDDTQAVTATTGIGTTNPTATIGAGGEVSTSPVDEPTATGAGTGAAGGTVIYNGGTNLSGLDPHITGAVVSWYVLDNIFDRLVRLDAETAEPMPSLAENVEVSDDGLTYTFSLKSGVTFHNGRAMVADDVVKSFERIQNPDVPAVAKGYFAAVDTIEASDETTVVVTYTEVFAPLLTALTRLETAIVPMEEVEKTTEWENHPVGTGPFKFESYVKDQATVLLKNEDYWEEGLPYLDTIEQRIITEAETALVNIRTGDIHVTQVSPKDLETLSSESSLTVGPRTSTFWAHLSLNTSVAPFDDLKVRQAIRLGINRDDIRALAFFDTGLISNTLLPEGNPYRAEVEGWEFDPEAAKALLAESSVPDGFSAVLRITAGNAPQLASAQIIQENLAEIGIEIELEQIESTTWFTEVFTNREYEMSMASHVSKVDPDLSMLDILHSGEFGTKNYTRFSDPEMDALLEEGRATIDVEKRKQIYADAQAIFVERSGYIVLNLQELAWAVNNTVQNFTVLPTGELRWKEVSIAE